MSFLSHREIRNQMFVVVGVAAVALTITTVLHERHKAEHPSVIVEAEPAAVESDMFVGEKINWDDVNLVTGHVTSPEDEIKTARGKMLGDFEAR